MKAHLNTRCNIYHRVDNLVKDGKTKYGSKSEACGHHPAINFKWEAIIGLL